MGVISSFSYVFVLSIILISGCASIGARQLRLDRLSFNDAVTLSENEQLLVNIVKLSYLEQISFLKVNNITTNFQLKMSANGVAGYNMGGIHGGGFSIGPGVEYSDNPTISYTPVTGQEFIQQILSPIKLRDIGLLLHGGIHDPNLILKLVFSSIGAIKNASEAIDLKVLSVPSFDTFYHLVDLVMQLALQKGVETIPVSVGGVESIALHFMKGFQTSPQAKEIRKILGINTVNENIVLVDDPGIKGDNIVQVQTRSIMGVLVCLSHGVEAPVDKLASNEIMRYHVDGMPYDWSSMLRNIIKIHYSDNEPQGFIKTKTHGYWYYIKYGDFDSIATFNFVNSLLILTAGNAFKGTDQSPLITIPVGK